MGENLSATQEFISPFTTGQNEMIERLRRSLNEVGVTAQVFDGKSFNRERPWNRSG